MALISQINGVIPTSPIQAREMFQGEQLTWEGTVQGQDISNWTITAKAEFATATVDISGDDIRLSNYEANPGIAARDLTATIVDGPTGRFDLQIPKDLYTTPIDANIKDNVPIAVCSVKIEQDGAFPDIALFKIVLVYRRGMP